MIICHCEQVHDKAVRSAVAGGARTIDDITARCGAGGSCGGCTEALEAILLHHERAPRTPRWRRHRTFTTQTA